MVRRLKSEFVERKKGTGRLLWARPHLIPPLDFTFKLRETNAMVAKVFSSSIVFYVIIC